MVALVLRCDEGVEEQEGWTGVAVPGGSHEVEGVGVLVDGDALQEVAVVLLPDHADDAGLGGDGGAGDLLDGGA